MDVFLTRFAPDGTRLWNRQWGAAGHDGVAAVRIGADGLIYVIGSTERRLRDTAGRQRDLFVARYNAAGERISMMLWETDEVEDAWQAVFDKAGGLYVCGMRGLSRLDPDKQVDSEALLIRFSDFR